MAAGASHGAGGILPPSSPVGKRDVTSDMEADRNSLLRRSFVGLFSGRNTLAIDHGWIAHPTHSVTRSTIWPTVS